MSLGATRFDTITFFAAVHAPFKQINIVIPLQIYAMPVFDMMETILVKKLHFTPSLTLRLIARSLYVGMFFSLLKKRPTTLN